MSAPAKGSPRSVTGLRSLKSILSAAVVLLIYLWASTGLQVSPGEFTSGQTWRNMGDLVIRMGPYHRIDRCRDARTVWGEEDPWAGRSSPAKVQAVCEKGQTVYWYRRDYLREQAAYARDVWEPLQQTFRMAILGTFLGAIAAVPFSLLAARNLVRSRLLYYAVRTVLSLIRTIPDLVLAAVLTGAFGLGALPAVLALAILSFALVAKLLSESIEAIDPGPLEAMQACGANQLQQIAFGVAPQVLPQFLAYTIYQLEINVRASTVLGLVGAGGIGQLLYADLNLLRYRNVGAVVAVLLMAVMLIDLVGAKLRERLV